MKLGFVAATYYISYGGVLKTSHTIPTSSKTELKMYDEDLLFRFKNVI